MPVIVVLLALLTTALAVLTTAWAYRQSKRSIALDPTAARQAAARLRRWIEAEGSHSLLKAARRELSLYEDQPPTATVVAAGPLLAAAMPPAKNTGALAEAAEILRALPQSRIGRRLSVWSYPPTSLDLQRFATAVNRAADARSIGAAAKRVSVRETRLLGQSNTVVAALNAEYARAYVANTEASHALNETIRWLAAETRHRRAEPNAPLVSPGTSETASAASRRTAEDAQRALSDLLDEWARYKLDTEAWYLTRPLLRDTTGTVKPTAAYNTAMQNLVVAVEDLGPAATSKQIEQACALADEAWAAWHAACDHAQAMGLGDRTPTERAALERLATLVERLTHSSADAPDLPSVKKQIQACLDKITTVAVSWADIAELPAISSSEVLRALPAAGGEHAEEPKPSEPAVAGATAELRKA